MKKLTILLDDDLHHAVKLLALHSSTTVSAIVRKLLLEHTGQDGKPVIIDDVDVTDHVQTAIKREER